MIVANAPDARLAAIDVRLFLRGQAPLHRLDVSHPLPKNLRPPL